MESENAKATAEEKPNNSPKKKDLAIDRTILSQERTLMAWVRTAASLMTFGFAIYKLLEARVREVEQHPILDVISPKVIALIMFSTGMIGLLLATIRHIKTMRMLNRYKNQRYFSLPLILSYVIMTLLVLLLTGTILSPN